MPIAARRALPLLSWHQRRWTVGYGTQHRVGCIQRRFEMGPESRGHIWIDLEVIEGKRGMHFGSCMETIMLLLSSQHISIHIRMCQFIPFSFRVVGEGAGTSTIRWCSRIRRSLDGLRSFAYLLVIRSSLFHQQ